MAAKRKIKKVFRCILLVLLIYVILSVLFSTFVMLVMHKVFLFSHYSAPHHVYLIVAAILDILTLGFAIVLSVDYEKEPRFIWFVKEHKSGLVISMIFLDLFVFCLHDNPVFGEEKALSLLGIEWAIFAIAVAAFALWQALVFKRVYSPKDELIDLNKEITLENELKKLEFLEKQNALRQSYISNFEPVIFIGVNFLALAFSTGAFLGGAEYNIVHETFVMFAGFCCTNALCSVLLGVITEMVKKRIELVRKTKVSPIEEKETLETVEALMFLDTLEKLDKETPLKDYESSDTKLNPLFARSYKLLEEYRNDKASINKNKKDLVELFHEIIRLNRKQSKKTKKPKRQEEESLDEADK